MEDEFDVEAAFAAASKALTPRTNGVNNPMARIRQQHTIAIAAWVMRQLNAGRHIVPSTSHVCVEACSMEIVQDHESFPLYVCTQTGISHACGSMCNVASVYREHEGDAVCPLTAITLDSGIVCSGWADGATDGTGGRTDYRSMSKMARSAAAVEAELDTIKHACSKGNFIGVGTSVSAVDTFCGFPTRLHVPRACIKTRVAKKRSAPRDAIISATSCCKRNKAAVVIMRMLASKARCEVEERKMWTWENDSRKALSRYTSAKRGKWKCVSQMINICYATFRKRAVDGIFITHGDFKRIVDAYSVGFSTFMTLLCSFENRDISENTRVTEEHVAAFLYMLSDGLVHNGITVVHRDLFMKAFLPEPSSLDSFGIDKSGYTSARNMIWGILYNKIRTSGPHDAYVEPIVVEIDTSASATLFT